MKAIETPSLLLLVACLGGCSNDILFGRFGVQADADVVDDASVDAGAENVVDAASLEAQTLEAQTLEAQTLEAQTLEAQTLEGSVDGDARGDDASDAPDAREAGESVCGKPPATVMVGSPNIVIPIYLAASDTDESVARSRVTYLGNALAAAQAWFGEAMAVDGKVRTFRFDPPRVVKSTHTRQQWDDFAVNGFPRPDAATEPCGLWNAATEDLANNGILANAGLPPIGTQGVGYLVIAGGGTGGGCVGRQISVFEEITLPRIEARCPNGVYDACARGCDEPGGLAGIDPWCSEAKLGGDHAYACAAVGGIASDLAYLFGMKFPDERPDAERASCGRLMEEWWEYRRTLTLCDADKADLLASGFIAAP